ncbi:hypothetical protein HanRHA438_Chr14g0670991 [Helianthus annuus]|nr:hypothetical protein HanRHA438_Chr14g0670991 [Helianthus annuus]
MLYPYNMHQYTQISYNVLFIMYNWFFYVLLLLYKDNSTTLLFVISETEFPLVVFPGNLSPYFPNSIPCIH